MQLLVLPPYQNLKTLDAHMTDTIHNKILFRLDSQYNTGDFQTSERRLGFSIGGTHA
jgi:hypothetical protein